jgi:hypothetical protein
MSMSGFEKALSSTSGHGGDVIVPQLADQIIPFIRQKSYLRQFLVSFNQPTETYRFPKLTIGNTVYYVSETSTAPESLVATGTVELVARKLMTALAISAELEEDSVLPIVPVIRDDMAKSFALAEENVWLNGDTTHTADAPTPAMATEADWFVNDVRLAFNGLMKLTNLTPYDMTSNPLSLNLISRLIRNLGVYGRDKSELLLTVSLKEEERLRELLGVNLAINQLGLTGTALPGEVGRVWGVPVVATNLLDMTGGAGTPPLATPVDPDPETKALILNRNAAVIGDRRIFVIKSSDEVLIRSDQILIVGSERISFQGQYPEAIATAENIGPNPVTATP